MTAPTIITIIGLLNEKINELEVEEKKAQEEYRKEEIILFEENPDLDDREVTKKAHDFFSYTIWQGYVKDLRSLRSALDDFSNHDFH